MALGPKDRERLSFSLMIALVLHVAIFLALEIFVQIEASRVPPERGPLFVELETEEVPVMDRVPVAEPPKVTKAETRTETRTEQPPAEVKPEPVAERKVEQQAPPPTPKPAAQAPPAPKPQPVPPMPPAAQVEEPVKPEFIIPSGPPPQEEPAPVPRTPQFRSEAARPATPLPTPQPKFQPLTESAPAEKAPALPSGPERKVTEGQAPPAPMPSPEEPLLVPVDQLDRALAGQGGSGTAGRAPAGPTPKAPEGRVASGGGKPPVAGQTSIGGRAAAGRTPSGESTYQITWEDPAQGRNPVNTPVPDLPPEARRGDRLQLVVEFTLTPSGFLSTVLQTKSCGITEVDNAVVAAVRRWTFEPVRSNRNVRGQVTFVIVSD